MTNFIEKKVTYKRVDEGSIGQKIDNYLIKNDKEILIGEMKL